MIYLPRSFCITFMPPLTLFCRKPDYDGYCSLDCRFPVYCQPSLVLSGNDACASKSLKTKLFQRVHYKFLCMLFQTFQVNFHVLPLKLSNYFSFVEPFFSSRGSTVGYSLFNLSNRLYHRTSGIYIRLSINFTKRAGKGVPNPIKYNYTTLTTLFSSHFYPE